MLDRTRLETVMTKAEIINELIDVEAKRFIAQVDMSEVELVCWKDRPDLKYIACVYKDIDCRVRLIKESDTIQLDPCIGVGLFEDDKEFQKNLQEVANELYDKFKIYYLRKKLNML